MKNSEIHTGLDQREVRDFLSEQMADTNISRPQAERSNVNSISIMDWAIESAQIARDLADDQIRQLETRKAIIILIEKMGWEEYDPSDVVTLDTEMYWSFIGTEEEFKMLINKIEKEDEIS